MRAQSTVFLPFPSIRTYWIQTRVEGERVKHCHSDNDNVRPRPGWDLLDCDPQDPTLTVVHGKLDATRCSLVEVAGQTGLNTNPVGAAASFSIMCRDSFGNTTYVHRARRACKPGGAWRLVSCGIRTVAVVSVLPNHHAFCIVFTCKDAGWVLVIL